MRLPRILVIDDQYATQADLRVPLCRRCKLVEVKAGAADAEVERKASGHSEIVAAVTFCSGQSGEPSLAQNSVQTIDDAISSGWPSSEGWHWALVLLDLQFDSKPDKRDGDESFGLTVLQHLVGRYPDYSAAEGNCEIPVVMLSGLSRAERNRPAGRAGALEYVEKDDLNGERLNGLLAEYGLLEDAQSMGRSAEKLLLGRSLPLLKILREARHIARRRLGNALILGPQGSGKSSLADYIHVHTGRKTEPVRYFVAPTTSDNQYAELFGFWKGAYTGAEESRAGRAEEANNGTLLIDEIHGLQTKSQQELLQFGRLVNDNANLRILRRLGSFPTSPAATVTQALQSVRGRLLNRTTAEIEVDVLVLAATNHPIDDVEWQKRHGFSDALYTRLATQYGNRVLVFPSLCERRADIRGLFRGFLETETRSIKGTWPKDIDEDVFEQLEIYEWPANVADLQGVARTVAKAARTFDEVLLRHLPSKPFSKPGTSPPSLEEPLGQRALIESEPSRIRADLQAQVDHLSTELARARADLENTDRRERQLTLGGLADELANLRVDPNDPSLLGVKPRIEAAVRNLMQRLLGAALERVKNPVTEEIKRTEAVELLTGEKISDKEKSKVPRLIKDILGQPQKDNKVTDDEVGRLLAAWRSGPGGKPDLE